MPRGADATRDAPAWPTQAPAPHARSPQGLDQVEVGELVQTHERVQDLDVELVPVGGTGRTGRASGSGARGSPRRVLWARDPPRAGGPAPRIRPPAWALLLGTHSPEGSSVLARLAAQRTGRRPPQLPVPLPVPLPPSASLKVSK